MAEQLKSKEELASAINKTLNEIVEVLQKSEVMGKAEGDEPEVKPEPTPNPDAVADAAGDHAEPDADNQPAPEGAPMGEPEGQPAPEGEPVAGEEGQGEEGDMASHAAELSDEELDMMLDVLMAEKEKRHASAPEAAAPGAAPAPEAAPAPAPEEAEKSMKKEFAGLAKSLVDIAEAVKALKGDVETMKKSQAAATAKKPVVTKPAAANDVQVLQKTQPVMQRLSKSDTLRFLEAEQRRGNKSVNTDVIAGVNACREDSELHSMQDELTKVGIKFPTV